ncbi:hypothetical protein [Natrinema halophilum]|uniref:hypothetical protein n=1 Tax=Natrinema halophilum TaxID=1699371 RepID=UPI001F1AC695|nr:hypothetical protein [Natrinema halophilum]UHQ96002.1 hypothetical protein HYG82_21220 [Natrinema halophilum]
MLDWSFSPLVATYFATRTGDTECGGAIWAVDYRQIHAGLPDYYQDVLEMTETHMLDTHLLSNATLEGEYVVFYSAASDRRAHRHPVGRLLLPVGLASVPRSMARGASRLPPENRRPGRAQTRVPRQTRPAQRHSPDAVPRTRGARDLVQAVLSATIGGRPNG